MGMTELVVLAVGLAMDAFAVSVCKGLSAGRVTLGHALTAGLWFGGFQALMPFLGWLLGVQFQSFITSIDHWIAFVLLGLIGINMIRESRSTEEEEMETSFGVKAMFPLAVATSIDALTVGITFAFLSVPIGPAVALIGVITCVLSAIGVKAGGVVGEKGKSWAELAGGVVLILMGSKILLEHLGILDKKCPPEPAELRRTFFDLKLKENADHRCGRNKGDWVQLFQRGPFHTNKYCRRQNHSLPFNDGNAGEGNVVQTKEDRESHTQPSQLRLER